MRRITSPEVFAKIEEYIQEYWPYDNTKKYPRIIGAYEDEYFYESRDPDAMGECGIFIEWEDDFDGYVAQHEQFIHVTVHELMRGDG